MGNSLNVLDLFSGIGGFSLGLERAGMRTVAFCEIEPYCKAVLRKHWPGVKIYDDVRTLTAERLRADGIYPDVICGGFPCQDISLAGAGAGIEGARSGLWSEYARLIGELRPAYALVENVAALLGRGLSRVLGDLAEIGYDSEWHCIPASAIGAEHDRDRVWIIAHDMRKRLSGRGNAGEVEKDAPNFEPWIRPSIGTQVEGLGRQGVARWSRDVHGIPRRMDRIKAIGNAVVPQIPEIIGRAIMKLEAA